MYFHLYEMYLTDSFYARGCNTFQMYLMYSFSLASFLQFSIAETFFSNKLGQTHETSFGHVPNVIADKEVTSILTYQLFISTDLRRMPR